MISCASRALTDVESRYLQTERKMLAFFWSAEHLHLYLFGASCVIYTYHKPPLGIFKNQRPASAGIEIWRLRLMPYQFELRYRPGKDDKNPADCTSRHPCSTESGDPIEDLVNYVCNTAVAKAMTLDQVRQHTNTDTVLQAITSAIKLIAETMHV